MDVRQIVEKFGGQTALAALVGVSQSAIAYWVKKGAIPTKWHSQMLALAIDKSVAIEASDLIARPRQLADARATSELTRSEEGTFSNTTEHEGLVEQRTPFMFYASQDGITRVQVLIEDETVWASQKGMGEIFGVESNTINYHLKGIFESSELLEGSVTRDFRVTAADNIAVEARSVTTLAGYYN